MRFGTFLICNVEQTQICKVSCQPDNAQESKPQVHLQPRLTCQRTPVLLITDGRSSTFLTSSALFKRYLKRIDDLFVCYSKCRLKKWKCHWLRPSSCACSISFRDIKSLALYHTRRTTSQRVVTAAFSI